MITGGVLVRLRNLFNEYHEDTQIHMDNIKLIVFRAQDEKFEHISLLCYTASRYLSVPCHLPNFAVCSLQ